MTTISRMYANQGSATRAAKKAYGETYLEKVKMFEKKGEFGFKELTEKQKEALKNKKSSKKPGRAKKTDGVCAKVFAMADKMKGARRKDVIEACVKDGINEATAKTQYQKWFTTSIQKSK